MNSNIAAGYNSLVVFSWGSFDRLETQLSALSTRWEKAFWVDPFAEVQRITAFNTALQHERIDAVLSAESGDIELRKYSLPGFYSLTCETSALKSLLPGLKATGTISVPAVTGELLTSRLKGLRGPLTVLIDCPGQEHVILAFLETSGLMQKLDTLYLRAGDEPFFEGSHSAIDLVQMLEKQALSAGEIYDDADPDWPVYRFKSDQRTHLVNDLRAQLDDLARERDAFQKAKTELQNKLAQRDHTLGRNAKEIEQQNVELQRLTKERDAAKASDTQSREDLAQKTLDAEVRSKKIESLEQEIDKVQKALAEERDRLAQCDDSLAQEAQTIKELNKKIAQLAEDVKTRDKEAERLTTELAAQDEIVSQHKQSADLQAKEIQQLTKERDAGQGKVAQLEDALKKVAQRQYGSTCSEH
ncbi:hypothetical protein [Sulfitobacter sp. 15WGC]|uniref:hypothetical protein n=1 Tax=Sulfitobacter sp. 15WGC TaxID=2575437 RepID=UPI0010ACD767|nr:hypothetical protein [Sulfitobacter sp. 15WGC]TKA84323.1 hypothetical protein FCK22_16465 [Sulfitobacter sp. 15WGC]